jgi:SHS2 domain-containing protein
MSPYRWVEHTGELELEIDADSERAVFEQGFEAMRELLASGPGEPMGPRHVSIAAPDHAALLADWLGELAFLAESEGFVPERLSSLELDAGGLEAVVEGSRGDPPHLVKAATYHRLALEPSGAGWRAGLVLDV